MLEDDYDIIAFREAYEEYQKDPRTYTWEETIRILEGEEEI